MKSNVLQWLRATAEKYNDKVAFRDSENSITFKEVFDRSRRIGSALSEHVTSGSPVAVISGRNVYTPVTFLGIVSSGCFYAPMDSAQPVHRLRQILDKLSPAVIVADRENRELAESLGYGAPILVSEELAEHPIDDERLAAIAARANELDPLYVIFTSGSTGVPKGVITSHHSLMCYIEAYAEVMGIDDSDVLGNQSPLDYIAAIRDIYLPVMLGASTFIIPKQYFSSPAKLFDVLNSEKITSIGWSVSALTLPTAMGAFDHAVPQYLKKVCFSGSVMPCKFLKIWQDKLPDTKFVNQYGPTEATASCTYYVVKEKVTESDVLPIGVPYRNYRVFLLNEDNTPTPQGEQGEICVSGPILALGYYNDPERTAQSFIQNPVNHAYNELIYKTGDLGVLRADGILEFHGRKDRQIKHLGHRVELGEIEEAVKAIKDIEEACAMYQQEKELIYLFYTGDATSKEIAVYLRGVLPGFMVPRKLIKLDAMPRLENGKTNMQELKNYFK